MIKAGVFDSRALGYGPGDTDKDRPIHRRQVSHAARLSPTIECGATIRSGALKRDSVISYDDLQPTDIPWLDLVRVEVANTRHGRVCLRLLPAARWRAATRVEIHVYRGRRLLAETWLRVDGRGQIKRTWVSKHAALGSDGPALAFVLPPSVPSGVTLRVAAAATSTQPAEPLLRNPVNAGDPDDEVRIPR